MPHISLTGAQSLGAFRGGYGLYGFGSWNGRIHSGLGGKRSRVGFGATGCPEGSHMENGECVCDSGRVWMPDNSKCVSPQSPAYTNAITWEESMEGHTPATYGQQELLPGVRNYIESRGHTIDCRIDPNWFAGPQGGTPAMLCSIDGGPYEHGAYAVNLNPYSSLVSAKQTKAAELIEKTTGIPAASLYSTPAATQLLNDTAATGVVNPQLATRAVAKFNEVIAERTKDAVPGTVVVPATTGSPAILAQTTSTSLPGQTPQPGETVMATPTSAGVPSSQTNQQAQSQIQPDYAYAGQSPYTGEYYTAPAGWTPPPYDYRGAPTAAYGNGAPAGQGQAGAFGSGDNSMLWIAGAALALLALNR